MQIKAIRKALSAPQEEIRVNRIWQGIESRRYAQVNRGTSRKVLAALCIAGIVGFVAFLNRMSADSEGPLLREDRSPLPSVWMEAPGVETVLSDGSKIRMEKKSNLEVLVNSGTEIRWHLHRGAVRFDVVPGKDKKWIIDCDGVEIMVVGTRFSVHREKSHVAVSVERGAVLVKGNNVKDGIQRLNAGGHLEVPRLSSAVSNSTAPPAVELNNPDLEPTQAPILTETHTTELGDETSDSPPLPKAHGEHPQWRAFAEKGDYRKAYEELGAAGVAVLSTQSRRPEELFNLADVARLGGHPRDAVFPLEKLIRNYPNNQKAGLAAFTLARLHLEQLGNPGEAAVLFEYAIHLKLPRAMIETAMARRVEALAKTGDDQMHIAAEAYLQKYPDGRYRARVQKWMGAPVQ